ncbi:TRAFs-binding domain-containing protein [Telluribacter sp. SYSU D00476]|uniref:TRAFs-binding domain-containing protein n=1 Tax=Telluribacter sp. SYSU D00476 TaxID=2811430 RepID=UPI001FF61B4F|nr:TRAFs-binding domain-containing protein [Telluribacter sp. SYSU D00476]
MPFGQKHDASGTIIDFDKVYNELIAPTIREAGLEPLRADEEMTGGVIHKPMFERLILCEYAVADLTTANANVFYELGIRHAVRPWSTVMIFAEGSRLPFDVALLRAMPYTLTAAGVPAKDDGTKLALAKRLRAARDRAADSPLFQLLDGGGYDAGAPLFQILEGMKGLDIARLKTDVFREQVAYSQQLKSNLADARRAGLEAIRGIENRLGDLTDLETGVVIDLFLSYRAVKAWPDMVRFFERMPRLLQDTVMVQEQYALALNRNGQDEKAESVTKELLKKRGASSETYGILGRIYKDRWERLVKDGSLVRARGELEKAINAYLQGFETDWRDAYPGVNACTLMSLKDTSDERLFKILPVVSYAVERRLSGGSPDYWDYATLLELAVLRQDEVTASQYLSDALANIREPFEPETTARNLRLIRESRERRGEEVYSWMSKVEEELHKV